MSATDNLINDASEAGKIYIRISVIIGVLIAIGLLIGSIVLFAKGNTVYQHVTADITAANCSPETSRCILTVTYTIDGADYTQGISTDKVYAVGGKIDLVYQEGQPNDVQPCCPTSNKTTAGIMLLIAVLMLGTLAFIWYMRNNKAFATLALVKAFY